MKSQAPALKWKWEKCVYRLSETYSEHDLWCSNKALSLLHGLFFYVRYYLQVMMLTFLKWKLMKLTNKSLTLSHRHEWWHSDTGDERRQPRQAVLADPHTWDWVINTTTIVIITTIIVNIIINNIADIIIRNSDWSWPLLPFNRFTCVFQATDLLINNPESRKWSS